MPPEESGYNAAVDLLERNLERDNGTRTAYIDKHGRCSYAELELGARQAGAVLTQLGVQREQRVLLCMHDSRYLPMCFLGAIRAGIIPILANTLLTEADYEYMLQDSRASVVIVSAPLAPMFESLAARMPGLNHVIVEGAAGDSLESMMKTAVPDWQAAATSADEACFWLYSSGSTGRPKGTVHVHSSMIKTAELYAEPVLGIKAEDVVFSAAKIFFAYGLGNALSFPLSVGATTVLVPERPTPELVFQTLREHKVTIFYGVPTLYAALLAHAEMPAVDDLCLRRCTSAGEALPADIGSRWQAHFDLPILDGIGSTEMLHIFLTNQEHAHRPGTTGRPLDGYELKITDDDGAPVGDGEMGELQVRGPTTASMYWNQRRKSQTTFVGEWTRTGDKYTIDDDGYYVYCGRSDDMLKVGGIYVSPTEVESALISHPAVLEAAVVGQVDEHGLTKPKAFVTLQSGHDNDNDMTRTLQEFVKSSLAPYKYPRWIEFVDELPKTATGKIQRFKLRQ